ncbi:MAG: GCN5-related N-acetyltransferase [Cyanobacteria bacterium RYN_339]|nr:GCN5-related N-acetyltransferase [Cyanobacteria bacterium RYN_339]
MAEPFQLRMARPADAAAIAEIYAPICRDTVISFEAEPPDATEIARRMEAVLARLPWLVCTRGGAVLGYAYARPYNERAAYQWTLEASIYLAEAARGQGLAGGLYTALFDLVRTQGYCSVIAGITLPNEASVRLHERFGFEPVGRIPAAGYKHGGWHDVGYWRRALRPAGPPPPLVPLAGLVDGPDWHAAIAAGQAAMASPRKA